MITKQTQCEATDTVACLCLTLTKPMTRTPMPIVACLPAGRPIQLQQQLA